MKTIIKTTACVMLVASLTIMCSCNSGKNKEFNQILLDLAEKDRIVDYNDWEQIKEFLESNKNHYSFFFDGETMSVESIKCYVIDFFNKRRTPMDIKFVGIGDNRFLNVKFYLERSGSMTPYDSPAGDGKFKSAIVGMLNNLPNEKNNHKLFVVNSSINEYPEGIKKFLADNNIFEATRGIGDPSFTDFASIFNSILNNTKDNELSILVTDMIYSTKNMNGVNPQKVFAEANGMTNAIFKNRVVNLSTLIVKMTGSYNGLYYSYNTPKGKKYNGQRPYYIIVIGNKENILRLTEDKAYFSLSKFQKLNGFENLYLFGNSGIYHPHYSILLNHPNIQGYFHPERGQTKQITEIKEINPDRNTGNIQLALAVDLSKMFIDDDYMLNKANYEVESIDDVSIVQIKPIDKKELSQVDKKYSGSATHIFIIESQNISCNQLIKIKLKNKIPSWVFSSSSDDDSDVNDESFSSTTFGLKYLLSGIYDSYNLNTDGAPYYFELNMQLNK